MKTNQQVEVFFFKHDAGGNYYFLLMKRTPERGGFWQPLTGGVEDAETHQQTIIREAKEETGLEQFLRIIATGYNFEFTDHGKNYTETIYGAEVPAESEVKISAEHDDCVWVNKDEALALLKWDNNKEGLRILWKMIATP